MSIYDMMAFDPEMEKEREEFRRWKEMKLEKELEKKEKDKYREPGESCKRDW